MDECVRCGEPSENGFESYGEGDAGSYFYCDNCWDEIEETMENGVYVQKVYANAFEQIPPHYQIYVPRESDVNVPQNRDMTQVDALHAAKKAAEELGTRAVFHYRETGSYWFVDEYLDEHPGIAEDVKKKDSGFLSRLFG